ncbi:MAG: MFS transporter [Prolixibacteraceae bacterium]|jgi:MFS family permease|nr:MFS transporter [Prolixibacteraceae bacterium]MBT7000943.1 MFS transporter [Prolixibacteraceae bacterium]MBT7397312.1 MFS transporter [Prolixibacteraceae bacterium]
MPNYNKNIIRLYLVKISKWFNLVMPVVVLFYQDNGMGMHEIFVLKSIYSVAIVAMEIPSGWMADIWGRKKTLIFGSILGSAGFLMYSFSYGFWAFVLAEVILGIGYSFVSGADSAMLFDSLKAAKKTDEYVKQEGRITSAGNFAEAFAGIAGGFLAAISLRTPFYFQFVVAALAIPASLTLLEPKFHSSEHIHSIKKLVRNIKNTLTTNHNLRISILLSAVTGTATLTFAWLVQPFFKAVDLPVEMFGIFWTALNLTVGVSSAFAHKVEMFLGKRRSILFIIVLLSLGYFLSGVFITFWGIAFLFLFYLVRGVATPVLKNYINQYTASEIRATMLSVRNFVIRITFAVIGPLLGWITDNISLNYAFMLAGGMYLISVLLIVFPWIRRE